MSISTNLHTSDSIKDILTNLHTSDSIKDILTNHPSWPEEDVNELISELAQQNIPTQLYRDTLDVARQTAEAKNAPALLSFWQTQLQEGGGGANSANSTESSGNPPVNSKALQFANQCPQQPPQVGHSAPETNRSGALRWIIGGVALIILSIVGDSCLNTQKK